MLIYTLLTVLACLIIYIVVIDIKLRQYKKRKLAVQLTEGFDAVADSRMGQSTECSHIWTSPHDYDSYPGAVCIVDSVCTKCNKKAAGSEQ